ncbi:flap endonuclease-1 [Candidatus Woesearchaeota archaeon]|nr:flap endonuclease-1 [Candidatus Woesearchaeota archaeon]
MGVQITELLPKREIKLEELAGRIVAVDASNHLYQFLTTIRGPDGSLFTDSKGNVTSHLIGLFSRTTHLMKLGIKPAYVFDGEMPQLKRLEIKRRMDAKEVAIQKLVEARKEGKVEDVKKYSALSTKLTRDMVADAKEVVAALGLPAIQAPGEGEAQAARIVANGDAFAVASQDADSLLFGATNVIRNLSIEGRRRQAGTLGYNHVEPEMIALKEVLSSMGVNQQQLICLAMLVGTDYNSKGIKGIGPKNALKLVKLHKTPEELFRAAKWDEFFSFAWQEVLELFEKPRVDNEYKLTFSSFDKGKLTQLLCEKHNFSTQRVEKTLDELEKTAASKQQKGLGDFFGTR